MPERRPWTPSIHTPWPEIPVPVPPQQQQQRQQQRPLLPVNRLPLAEEDGEVIGSLISTTSHACFLPVVLFVWCVHSVCLFCVFISSWCVDFHFYLRAVDFYASVVLASLEEWREIDYTLVNTYTTMMNILVRGLLTTPTPSSSPPPPTHTHTLPYFNISLPN